MKRTLEDLQKRYNSHTSAKRTVGVTMPGPGGPRRGPGGPGMHGVKTPPSKNAKKTAKRLISYITAYTAPLILVLFLMLFSTGTSLIGSYIARPIINNITDISTTAAERIANLAQILSLMLCIYLLGVISSYLQSRIMLHISQNAVQKIRNDLFVKLQKLPVKYFDTNSTGEIM